MPLSKLRCILEKINLLTEHIVEMIRNLWRDMLDFQSRRKRKTFIFQSYFENILFLKKLRTCSIFSTIGRKNEKPEKKSIFFSSINLKLQIAKINVSD